MYDELIKRLRKWANSFCGCCKHADKKQKACDDCTAVYGSLWEAADVIEELQKKYNETQDALITADITRVYLEDVLKYIKTLAENYKAHNRWIPVTERLPDGDADVLVTDGNALAVGYYRPDANAWDSCEFGWIENRPDPFPPGLGTVTHWMPLPEPPESEG